MAKRVDSAPPGRKSGGMSTHQPRSASPSRTAKVLQLATALGLAAMLAACGPSVSPGAPGTSNPASVPSPSASSPAAPTEATPSSMAPETTTAAPAETPLCTAASLTGALDASGGGAAGSVFMKLTLTNSSAASCILDGYAGVSMVNAGASESGSAPEPIGAPAVRNTNEPSAGPITLAPGVGATAVLQYTQADNYQNCQREQADSVLVYPPSATDWLEIPHPLTACSNADIELLHLGAFQPQA